MQADPIWKMPAKAEFNGVGESGGRIKGQLHQALLNANRQTIGPDCVPPVQRKITSKDDPDRRASPSDVSHEFFAARCDDPLGVRAQEGIGGVVFELDGLSGSRISPGWVGMVEVDIVDAKWRDKGKQDGRTPIEVRQGLSVFYEAESISAKGGRVW